MILFLYALYGSKSVVARDEEQLCPINQKYDSHIVLIDKTDKYSILTIKEIRAEVEAIVDNVARYDGLILALITEESGLNLVSKFSRCNPGGYKDINVFIENKDYARINYTTQFFDPLNSILTESLQQEEHDSSPIIETLVRVGGDVDYERIENIHVYIFSDFLQNSSIATFYKNSHPSWDTQDILSQPDIGLNAISIFSSVHLFMVLRENKQDRQKYDVRNAWTSLLSEVNPRYIWKTLENVN